MSEAEPIVCKPTRWFIWRAVAMIAMFAVLGGWFFKDWKYGYPKKNLAYYTYQAFERAEEEFREQRKKGVTPEEWARFAAQQTLEAPDEKGVLPAGMEGPQPWPEILQDYGKLRAEIIKEGRGTVPVLWSDYSNEQGWDERPKTAYGARKVRNQLIYAVICGVLALAGLGVLLRTLGRRMVVDGEAFYAPGGQRVPFGDIVRVDKRKWESKGLAYLFYRKQGGETGKAKVDGMVYGQFNPEEGAPAQALFDRIMANFSGELVDIERERTPGTAEEESSAPGE